MTDSTEREREIVQLQRLIEASDTPGVFGFLLRYFGVLVLTSIGLWILIDFHFLSMIFLLLMLLGYPIWWARGRITQSKRKARLRKILEEEGQDIRRDRE